MLLAELLSGARPYRVKRDTPAAVEEAILQTNRSCPAAIFRHARRKHVACSVRPSSAKLRGDLDNIVSHALRKDPEKRYAIVDLLAQDISRHPERRGDPRATRQSLVLRGEVSRASQLAVGLAAGALLSLVGGLGIALWGIASSRDRSACFSRPSERLLEGVFLAIHERADPVRPVRRRPVSCSNKASARSTRPWPTRRKRKRSRSVQPPELQHQLALDEAAVALNCKRLALASSTTGPMIRASSRC